MCWIQAGARARARASAANSEDGEYVNVRRSGREIHAIQSGDGGVGTPVALASPELPISSRHCTCGGLRLREEHVLFSSTSLDSSTAYECSWHGHTNPFGHAPTARGVPRVYPPPKWGERRRHPASSGIGEGSCGSRRQACMKRSTVHVCKPRAH